MDPVPLHGQYCYFITFIDDYSCFTLIYFLHSKADVFTVFQTFVAFIEIQYGTGIKVLHSNSGGEYMSHSFQTISNKRGLFLSVPILILLSKTGPLSVRIIIS